MASREATGRKLAKKNYANFIFSCGPLLSAAWQFMYWNARLAWAPLPLEELDAIDQGSSQV